AAARTIGSLMQQGKRDEAQAQIEESARLKAEMKTLEARVPALETEQQRLLLDVPHIPHPSAPVGRTPEDNVTVAEHGARPAFDFEPLPHWDLTERHALVDFERGARVTGAGFPFYVGAGARLQRALINFFLD